jgi:hypothetical protein
MEGRLGMEKSAEEMDRVRASEWRRAESGGTIQRIHLACLVCFCDEDIVRHLSAVWVLDHPLVDAKVADNRGSGISRSIVDV